ncbi:bifunctional D-glycero-beta-D-manno-heptose-7-phosphate kinase/D-glycero-beta-D-manno-heptose 1-phosphate adenylyltransferase HldE [Geomonas sp. RF6]|uniref:bifunctional D-glycero-beta-D-manno-heptose-7-phosphate kinase/D-glycero-beta-D-manno-heptose 1-phosphate adenylyltransferase HldE n=1 Tax=Geomonas sp. RF6 TaxID=2897342 RepID=UPI001E5DD877|nr:bifunctional D-glycero-beta-D-manno-heptose-7-phosphate kinase/D-glycero-beta-D-manno-heptose 1-phosphate adenylyltransferase HldE [Geomonas sp. RF6]UFS68651.1 bifunctional D-glycero-beta-D-manno-heptose-7-phosphate kinase/D-glycero-beta-D-manno-heptose 1-phosphate adenylyltransferase HldE [Geomonas sp. RF6]
MERREVESFFAKATGVRALVIGDLMLDEYLWGRTERISPEAPVQVVEVSREDLRLGGAGNVVNNLVALGCSVTVCSVIGDDDNGALLRRAFEKIGADLSGVVEEPGRRTSKKTRVIAANQQIVRIDRETTAPISSSCESALLQYLSENAEHFNVILVSDYLKGVLTPALLAALCQTGRELSIPVVVDPKGKDYGKYRGATILTPNRKEAEAASGTAITDLPSLEAAADTLLSELELDALLITRSEQGMSLFFNDGAATHIPTVAREVFDVTGAGDTVLSVLSLGLACGLPLAKAAWVANVAAGIAVGKLGTSTVSPDEIVAEVGHGQKDSDSKIKNLDVVARIAAQERTRGKRIVFTNGCFDLLHVGHVKYLQKAREFGDMLIVGLNSDDSVRRLKGESRPLIDQAERAHILAALDCVDFVVIFDEDTPIRLIETIRPMVLVKGGDYTREGVVGHEIVEGYGGRIELVQFVAGRSTTRIIEKIMKNYS